VSADSPDPGARPDRAHRNAPWVYGLPLVALALGAYFLSQRDTLHEKAGKVMGPVRMRVTLAADAGLAVSAEEALEQVFTRVETLNALLSAFVETSDVSRLNRAERGERVPVAEPTWEVMMEALRYHRLSDGAFDVTVGPLMELYRPLLRAEAGGSPPMPEDATVEEAMEKVGSEHIGFDPARREIWFEREGMRVDLGAIAKGFAVDEAIRVLRDLGASHALVEIGGEVRTIGQHPEGRPWRVRMEDPARSGPAASVEKEILDLADRAIATSGNYRQFFERDGVRYSHIVDPRTGAPVSNDLAGVTILAPRCVQADAVATAVSVLGADAGTALVERLPGAEAVLQMSFGGGEGETIRAQGPPR
jgi:thiamine biosynthesis lipoprotein